MGLQCSYRENSISSLCLESPHQVDMKNVVKSSKHFFEYFNTLETHSEPIITSLVSLARSLIGFALFCIPDIGL